MRYIVGLMMGWVIYIGLKIVFLQIPEFLSGEMKCLD